MKDHKKRALGCALFALLNLPFMLEGSTMNTVTFSICMTCSVLFFLDQIKL